MGQLSKALKLLYGYSPSDLFVGNYNLDAITSFLEYIGNPQKNLKFIHVTGTSGKGSTVSYITNILCGSGLKVGSFYSPHIYSPRERIQLNDSWISVEVFESLLYEIDAKVRIFQAETGIRRLTFFELLFAMTLVFFQREKVDVAVIEVGLGGKLDATNVIDSQVCCITNVSLDHTKILGDTEVAIARDKMSIVKADSVLITGVKQIDIRNMFNKELDNEILYSGEDYFISRKKGYQYRGMGKIINDFTPKMIGHHQLENISSAITTALVAADKYGYKLTDDCVRSGINSAALPGRIEVVQESPQVIWDAAHNKEKMKALVDTIKSYDKDFIVLLAFKRGQNIKAILDELQVMQNKISRLVFTKYKITQDIEVTSEDFQDYIEMAKQIFPNSVVDFEEDAQAAYKNLKTDLNSGQSLVVTGSFYLLSSLAVQILINCRGIENKIGCLS